MRTNREKTDVGFSAGIVLFGLYVVYGGIELGTGSLGRIGPGFFPLLIGAMMTALGLGVPFERQRLASDETFNFRGLFFVSAALFAFAVLVETAGLFPAIAALVVLAMMGGSDRLSPLGAVATIACLCAVGYLLFILALNLPFEPVSGFAG